MRILPKATNNFLREQIIPIFCYLMKFASVKQKIKIHNTIWLKEVQQKLWTKSKEMLDTSY